MSYFVRGFSHLRNGRLYRDGQLVFESEVSDNADWAKDAYRQLGVQYPKFFKMDPMSKYAFLCAEVLLGEHRAAEDTALVFANASASLDTDLRHEQSVNDASQYFPSPAIFVYTLPNICIGEISIRHELKTDNSFFIFDAFKPDFMRNYAAHLLESGKAEEVLCAWVEHFEAQTDMFMYLVSRNGRAEHSAENLKLLYTHPLWKH